MKVRILKHCKINGKSTKPGDVHDVHRDRAKALTDNGYAEHHDVAVAAVTPASTGSAPATAEAPAPAPSSDSEPLTDPVAAAKDPQAE